VPPEHPRVPHTAEKQERIELTQEYRKMKHKGEKRKVSEDEKQARLDAFDLMRIPHPRLRHIREKTRSLITQTMRVRERNTSV
jgi:hypothetical protein